MRGSDRLLAALLFLLCGVIGRAQDTTAPPPAEPAPSATEPAPSATEPAPTSQSAPPADVLGVPILEGGVLELRPARDHLVLGRDSAVDIDVVTVDPHGQPVEPTDLVLLTNVGSTSAPQRTGPGRFRFTYRPPTAAFPHVAIIAARAAAPTGRLAGVVAIPLWGQGRLNVETKAQSVVTLRVGDVTFGPVTANDAGVAVLEVTAPPGPTFGIAESLDIAGNESKQKVDLGVPAFNRIALFPLGEARAGRKAELLLLGVDRRGAMLSDAEFKLTTSRGTVAEPVQLRAGVWLVSAEMPADVGNARVVVSAELVGERLSTVEAHLPLLPAPPARATVRLTPTSYVAGSGVPIVIKVDVVDEHDNPVPTEGMKLETSLGTAMVQRHVGAGLLRGVWTPGDNFGGASTATVVVKDVDGRALGEATLGLSPGAAQRLVLGTPQPSVRPGVPRGAYDVVATATDAHGNTVPSATLSFQSPDGATLVSRDTQDDGSVRLTFLPPASTTPGIANVTIRSDVGAAEVVAVPVQVVPRPLLRVAPKLAAHWNLGRLGLIGGALDATLLVPVPLPSPSLRLSVAFTAATGLTASTPLSLSLTQPFNPRRLVLAVPALGIVGAELQWRRLVLTGGLGGGLQLAQARLATPAQDPLALLGALPMGGTGEAVRLSAAGPALTARAGLGVVLGPGVLMGDVRLDAPLFLGSALTGFTGGMVWGLGYALQL